MAYLLAVDPGGNIGVALRLPNGSIATHRLQTQELLWDYFVSGSPLPDHVIVEEWTYRDGIARPEGVLTASLVSSLRGICYVLNIPIALRTPGSRYGYMDEATKWYQKRYSVTKPNKGHSHEIDALAHLLTWEHQYTK